MSQFGNNLNISLYPVYFSDTTFSTNSTLTVLSDVELGDTPARYACLPLNMKPRFGLRSSRWRDCRVVVVRGGGGEGPSGTIVKGCHEKWSPVIDACCLIYVLAITDRIKKI